MQVVILSSCLYFKSRISLYVDSFQLGGITRRDATLVTFTEGIFDGKLHFWCSGWDDCPAFYSMIVFLQNEKVTRSGKQIMPA